jgi:NADPH-ferrihemoprotein reductase
MLDTTDLVILILITIGTIAYFTKGKLWAKPAPAVYGYGGTSGKGTANGVTKPKKTRNIVERMEQQNKNVVVFFGSQTGTAGEFPSTLVDGIGKAWLSLSAKMS